ncbi:hypothetical protein GCM10017711_04260 [Paeniglutamicibacter sulfureus]
MQAFLSPSKPRRKYTLVLGYAPVRPDGRGPAGIRRDGPGKRWGHEKWTGLGLEDTHCAARLRQRASRLWFKSAYVLVSQQLNWWVQILPAPE